MNDNELIIRIRQHETSHVVHLLLSLISAGLWIPVWILITLSNSLERGRLMRQLRKQP
jgi:cytochrome c biogenesis protein CcdA